MDTSLKPSENIVAVEEANKEVEEESVDRNQSNNTADANSGIFDRPKASENDVQTTTEAVIGTAADDDDE